MLLDNFKLFNVCRKTFVRCIPTSKNNQIYGINLKVKNKL